MEKIGEIFREDRDVYLIIHADGEVYHFGPGDFSQSLTRFARGCKIEQIEKKMPELMEEIGHA